MTSLSIWGPVFPDLTWMIFSEKAVLSWGDGSPNIGNWLKNMAISEIGEKHRKPKAHRRIVQFSPVFFEMDMSQTLHLSFIFGSGECRFASDFEVNRVVLEFSTVLDSNDHFESFW